MTGATISSHVLGSVEKAGLLWRRCRRVEEQGEGLCRTMGMGRWEEGECLLWFVDIFWV